MKNRWRNQALALICGLSVHTVALAQASASSGQVLRKFVENLPELVPGLELRCNPAGSQDGRNVVFECWQGTTPSNATPFALTFTPASSDGYQAEFTLVAPISIPDRQLAADFLDKSREEVRAHFHSIYQNFSAPGNYTFNDNDISPRISPPSLGERTYYGSYTSDDWMMAASSVVRYLYDRDPCDRTLKVRRIRIGFMAAG